jgi:hypothetical protein
VVSWSEFLAKDPEARLRFPPLLDFLRSSGSGTGSTQPRKYIEEIFERKNRGSCLENREYGSRDPSRWPRGTLYPQNLALTSLTSGCRSVDIVRSGTQATEFSYFFHYSPYYHQQCLHRGTSSELVTFSKRTQLHVNKLIEWLIYNLVTDVWRASHTGILKPYYRMKLQL